MGTFSFLCVFGLPVERNTEKREYTWTLETHLASFLGAVLLPQVLWSLEAIQLSGGVLALLIHDFLSSNSSPLHKKCGVLKRAEEILRQNFLRCPVKYQLTGD